MNPEELRLECLKLALSVPGGSSRFYVDAARSFADFVAGVDRAERVKEAKAAIERAAS